MHDPSLVGTARMTAMVQAWDNDRTPDDGPPDRIVETTVYTEADGTVVTDPARMAAIDAIQAAQAEGEPHVHVS